jgi:FOG: WD40 repeat
MSNSAVQVNRIHSLTGHRDCVYTLEPAGADHLFFSGAGDGMVVAWNLEHPEEGELIAKLPNSIYALHHLPKANLLIAGHNYDGIHALDWRNKKEVASLHLGKASIFDVKSFDDFLLVAAGDGSITKVSMANWNVVGKTLASEKNARSIAIHPSKEEFAVGYSDNYIRIFSLIDLTLKMEWQAHANSVFTLRYTPDFQFLVSGSRDARLKAWDVTSNYSQAEEVVAHLFAINHLDFSPDGKHFVTCSMDKSIKVWQSDSFKLLKVIDKARHAGHGTSVNKLLWTSFQHQLVSASDDRSISVWNLFFNLTTTKPTVS